MLTIFLVTLVIAIIAIVGSTIWFIHKARSEADYPARFFRTAYTAVITSTVYILIVATSLTILICEGVIFLAIGLIMR